MFMCIHRDIRQVVREADVGEASRPLRPEEKLKRGEGACRDIAELFVEICRSAGLAMRFVSGYASDDPKNKRYMHAWAEVYLPGPGWRGYDPSAGEAVTDRHVAVAAGLNYENAAPVIGTYSGEADGVELSYETTLTTAADETEAREWLGTLADDGRRDESI